VEGPHFGVWVRIRRTQMGIFSRQFVKNLFIE